MSSWDARYPSISQIWKRNWDQVTPFFAYKWIKQHLRIKAFYGTSDNAVKTQIWIAVSMYVLVARPFSHSTPKRI